MKRRVYCLAVMESKDLNTEVRHQTIKASRISGCLNETLDVFYIKRNHREVRTWYPSG